MLYNDEPHFLMGPLHQVSHKYHFLFQELFDNIKTTGIPSYIM